MSNETDKFVKDYKVTQKRLKELSPAEGAKRKKAVMANLDKTWTAEDNLSKAIEKVRQGGMTSKKPADYVKHKDVVKPLKAWQDALKIHHDELASFSTYCSDAAQMHSDMSKRIAAAEKDMKKTGGMSDIKAMSTIKEAKRGLPDLKKTAELYGSLPGHAVLYGRNLQRSIEAIVNGVLKEFTPQEFPKSLDADNRKKTVRALKDYVRKIPALCTHAEKELSQSSPAKAEKALGEAEKVFANLEKLNDDAKTVQKKMKKELKLAEDGKEIAALMKKIEAAHKDCAKMIDDLQDRVFEEKKLA